MTELQTISWIFLSIDFASQQSSASINEISNIADGINHSVPNNKELQDSIKFLTFNGYIIKSENKYSISDLGKKVLDEAKRNTKSVFDIWQNLEHEIRASK